MAEIKISTGYSGRLTASFLFSPYLVSKIKTIEGYRWHPIEESNKLFNKAAELAKKYDVKDINFRLELK